MSFSEQLAALLATANENGLDILLYVNRSESSNMPNFPGTENGKNLDNLVCSTGDTQVFSTKKQPIAAGNILSNAISRDPVALGLTRYGMARATEELVGTALLNNEYESIFD